LTSAGRCQISMRMLIRPDLDSMSRPEKEALIHMLFDKLDELMATVERQVKRIDELEAKVEKLEGQLALNSKNSSKPPSSDRLELKPAIPRQKGLRKSGGQPGHGGATLLKIDSSQVDEVVEHCFDGACVDCGRVLPQSTDCAVLPRQVFELPETAFRVVEHRVMQATCRCGRVHQGSFPAEVSAPAQYGPRVKAAAVLLNAAHMVPLARTAEILGSIAGFALSEASVKSFVDEAALLVEPAVEEIARLCRQAGVLHADETGMRADGVLAWAHVAATPTLTHVSAQPRRGRQGIAGAGVLAEALAGQGAATLFGGVLVHDGWMAYKALECEHALCNAHHVRELRFVEEEMGQPWAKAVRELLLQACAEARSSDEPTRQARVDSYARLYYSHLGAGFKANPRNHIRAGSRGRPAQGKALNLLDRLYDQAEQVWRFLLDKRVPFSNNIGERAMRMPKVKMKVAGCFRTFKGLRTFCTLRSYLDTMQKQGHGLFDALLGAFQGCPPGPLTA